MQFWVRTTLRKDIAELGKFKKGWWGWTKYVAASSWETSESFRPSQADRQSGDVTKICKTRAWRGWEVLRELLFYIAKHNNLWAVWYLTSMIKALANWPNGANHELGAHFSGTIGILRDRSSLSLFLSLSTLHLHSFIVLVPVC